MGTVNRVVQAVCCDGYSELESLLAAIKDGKRYLAILMDIEWNGSADGIEAAHKVQQLDKEARIIYYDRVCRTLCSADLFKIREYQRFFDEAGGRKPFKGEFEKD